ncbi:LamG domain-containing protein [Patescibacteria group bacterium]
MKHSKEKLNTLTKFSILVALVVVPVFSYVIFDVSAGQIINKVLKRESLDQGLVGHWTFDGKDVNQATNVITDTSGQGNDGTTYGYDTASTTAIGKIGQALEFDGSDDYVQTIVNEAAVTQATFSAWIKVDTIDSWDAILFNRGAGSQIHGMLIESTDNIGYIWNNDSSTYNWDSGLVLPIDKWVFVVIVVTPSDVAAYLGEDEVLSSASNSNSHGSATFDDLRIGEDEINTDRRFDGLIDDARFYNRALSADEIERLYQLGATAKINKTLKPANSPLEDGLVGHWTFDGKDVNQATNVITDTSGQGNDGTTYGYDTASTTAIGKIGQALEFDGSDDYVDTNYGADLVTFTTSVWVRAETSPDSSQNQILWRDVYGIGWGHTDPSFRGAASVNVGGTYYPASFGTLNGQQWYHLVSTYDGETLVSYKDSVQITANTSPSGDPNTSSQNVFIGKDNSGFFDGLIDDVRIYNRALSADEIERLYQLGR